MCDAERIIEVRSEKGMEATERVVKSRDRLGTEMKKKEGKKKLRQSGKLSPSISIWTQRTLPNMERQTE